MVPPPSSDRNHCSSLSCALSRLSPVDRHSPRLAPVSGLDARRLNVRTISATAWVTSAS